MTSAPGKPLPEAEPKLRVRVLIRETAPFLAANVLAFGASFLINLLTARILGPQGRGVVSVALAVPSLVAVLSNPGLHLALPIAVGRREISKPTAIVIAIVASIAVGLCMSAALFVLRPLLSVTLFREVPDVVQVVAIGLVPASLLVLVLAPTLAALGYTRNYVRLRLAHSAVLALSALALAYLGAMSPLSLVIAVLVSLSIGVFVGALGLTLREGQSSWVPAVGRLLRFGLRAHVGTVAQQINYRLDLLLVAALLPATQLGFYSLAVSVAEVVWQIPDALVPRLLGRTTSATGQARAEISAAVFRLTIVFATGLAVVVALTSDFLVSLLLPAFHPALKTLSILLVATVAASMYRTGVVDLAARGYPGRGSAIALAGLVLSLFVYPAGIAIAGIEGAALACAFVYCTEASLVLWSLAQFGFPVRAIVGSPATEFARLAHRLINKQH
jgi:O-antigen/teichoic acid export membrane protein